MIITMVWTRFVLSRCIRCHKRPRPARLLPPPFLPYPLTKFLLSSDFQDDDSDEEPVKPKAIAKPLKKKQEEESDDDDDSEVRLQLYASTETAFHKACTGTSSECTYKSWWLMG